MKNSLSFNCFKRDLDVKQVPSQNTNEQMKMTVPGAKHNPFTVENVRKNLV